MKEEDLKKNLDKIIIDGLIKEAEQENADFEAAMKKMSNEDFLELIMNYEHAKEEVLEESGEINNDETVKKEKALVYSPESGEFELVDQEVSLEPVTSMISRGFTDTHGIHLSKGQRINFEKQQKAKATGKKPFRKFVPWITSALAAAACILAIVLPTVHHANGKLCDGALMMSQQYMTSSKGGFDIASASEEEVKNMLPMLERNYNDCIKVDGKSVTYTAGLQECGWDLTLAYLKLHKKGKAIDVLKVLAQQYQGTAFGNHCENLLKQLE